MPLPSADIPALKALNQLFQASTHHGERAISPVTSGALSKQVLGRLRHPTGDKPPLHIYRASPPTAARAPVIASGLVVASGLAPRWAAQQPQQTHPSYPRHTEQAGFGAASPPNGGQAPSPHLPRQPPDCGQSARHGNRACCGERACPALGCAAAPTNPPQLPQTHRAIRFWRRPPRYSAPAIGQTPHHRYIRTPISGSRSNTKY